MQRWRAMASLLLDDSFNQILAFFGNLLHSVGGFLLILNSKVSQLTIGILHVEGQGLVALLLHLLHPHQTGTELVNPVVGLTSFPFCKAFASGADNLLANPIVFFVVAFAAFFLADSAFLSAAFCSLVNFWASLFSSASICFSVFLLSPFVPVQDWKQVIKQCRMTICYLKYLKV